MGIRIADVDNNGGARITGIFSNSGAEKAKLEVNDIVISLEGKPISSGTDLALQVRKKNPGDLIVVRVRRGEEEFDVTIGLQYPPTNGLSRGELQNRMGGKLSKRRQGFPIAFQHDTILKPEECGGPLVNLSGKVVGINIARAGRTESYAIPTDIIRPLIEKMKSGNYAPIVPLKQRVETPPDTDIEKKSDNSKQEDDE